MLGFLDLFIEAYIKVGLINWVGLESMLSASEGLARPILTLGVASF